MKRLFALLPLLMLLGACTRSQQPSTTRDNAVSGIKIPSDWIEKARRGARDQNAYGLITTFASFIKPDTLFNPLAGQTDSITRMPVTTLFVDLDDEPGEEMISLLGWHYSSPLLCVFKRTNDTWYLIYREQLSTFYAAPVITVANNYSPNKTFYLSQVNQHGSGIYKDDYSFYKLVKGKVYKALTVVKEARIYGWGLDINQNITTNVTFSSDTSDQIMINYNYQFFPGNVKTPDCESCADPDVFLIAGEDNMAYTWDEKSNTYKLNIVPYKNSIEDLTKEKIACFGNFGNDSLFVSAFGKQIQEKLKTGTPMQKKLLSKYIARVKTRTANTF